MRSALRTVETRCEMKMVVRPCMSWRSPLRILIFGVGVNAGKSVVEHKDAGFANDSAGNGGPLLLSSRKSQAALANHGLVFLGKTLDILAMLAIEAARCTCSSVAFSTPKAMFSR